MFEYKSITQLFGTYKYAHSLACPVLVELEIQTKLVKKNLMLVASLSGLYCSISHLHE